MLVKHNLQFAPHERKLELFIYSKEEIEEFWPELEPFIARACKASQGMMDVESVHKNLLDAYCVAFSTVYDGAITSVTVVRLVEYADHKVLRITACAGRDIAAAMKYLPLVEAWGFAQGADELEAWCRPGMVRLLRKYGWKTKFTAVSRNIRRTLQ